MTYLVGSRIVALLCLFLLYAVFVVVVIISQFMFLQPDAFLGSQLTFNSVNVKAPSFEFPTLTHRSAGSLCGSTGTLQELWELPKDCQ